MAQTTSRGEAEKPRRRRRATTVEARERQLSALAFDLAEQQLKKGTASPSVITHLLKLQSQREKLEMSKLVSENELLKARVEALASAQRQEELYDKALKAFKTYSGQEDSEEDEYYDY